MGNHSTKNIVVRGGVTTALAFFLYFFIKKKTSFLKENKMQIMKRRVLEFQRDLHFCTESNIYNTLDKLQYLFSEYLPNEYHSITKACSDNKFLFYYSCQDCSTIPINSSTIQKILAKQINVPHNVICEECFDTKLHEGHHVIKHVDNKGKRCDCGRVSSLNPDSFCKEHKLEEGQQENDQEEIKSNEEKEEEKKISIQFLTSIITIIVSKQRNKLSNLKHIGLMRVVLNMIKEYIQSENHIHFIEQLFMAPFKNMKIIKCSLETKQQQQQLQKHKSILFKIMKHSSRWNDCNNNNSMNILNEILLTISDHSISFATFFSKVICQLKDLLNNQQKKDSNSIESTYLAMLTGNGFLRSIQVDPVSNFNEPLIYLHEQLVSQQQFEQFVQSNVMIDILNVIQMVSLYGQVESINSQLSLVLSCFKLIQLLSIHRFSDYLFHQEDSDNEFIVNIQNEMSNSLNESSLITLPQLIICQNTLTTCFIVLCRRAKVEYQNMQIQDENQNEFMESVCKKFEQNIDEIYQLIQLSNNKQMRIMFILCPCVFSIIGLLSIGLNDFNKQNLQNRWIYCFGQKQQKTVIQQMEFILRSYLPINRISQLQTVLLNSLNQHQSNPLIFSNITEFHHQFNLINANINNQLSFSPYDQLVLTMQILTLSKPAERIDSCPFFQTLIHNVNQEFNEQDSIFLPSLPLALSILMDSSPLNNFCNIFQIQLGSNNTHNNESEIEIQQILRNNFFKGSVDDNAMIQLAQYLLKSKYPSSDFTEQICDVLFLSQLSINLLKIWSKQCNHNLIYPSVFSCILIKLAKHIQYTLSLEKSHQNTILQSACYLFFSSEINDKIEDEIKQCQSIEVSLILQQVQSLRHKIQSEYKKPNTEMIENVTK